MFLPDNDVLIKLATFDLVDEAAKALGVNFSETYILPTAKYVFRVKNPAKAANKYGAKAASRLADIVRSTKEISWVDHEDVQKFETIAGIDPGEAVLFSATKERDDFLIATGDKRCIKTLVAHPQCTDIVERVAGKVVCFEQVIGRTCGNAGFALVRERVCPALSCDGTIGNAFANGLSTVEGDAIAYLDGRTQELRMLARDILAK